MKEKHKCQIDPMGIGKHPFFFFLSVDLELEVCGSFS